MNVPTIRPQDVGEELLLDVREQDEWSAGRAPNAVHIPLYDLPDRFDEIPADRPLNVVCKVGSRSAQATAWLIAQGVDARNVEGGMYAWVQLGLPVEGDGDRAWIA
ncbi:MAG: rhodanese [Frankiales bacterium]|nr:rhodanese [Frankiales bacterium]